MFDLSKLIEVLAEHAPNEAVGLFITTYGVFILTFILIIIVLVRFFKKASLNKEVSEQEIQLLKNEIAMITKQAADISINNTNVSQEIKDEIRANNDATMQLLIAMGITSGMNYTDITNVIEKATAIYKVSKEQYEALENEASTKADEELKAKADEEAKAKEKEDQLNNDLASIIIG